MFDKLFTVIPADLVITVGMCFLASLCVAIVMRFFVKMIFVKLDEFISTKTDKEKAIYATVKSALLTAFAFVLTAFALSRLMKICVFPADNSKALAIFYFIPMVALQYFLDTHMKRLACKAFGLPFEEKEKEAKKEEKIKKFKIDGVWYIKDVNGQLVPYIEGDKV